MRHPGVGIGIGGIGVGLGTFVLQTAGVELPTGALIAVGVVAVLMIFGGLVVAFAAGGSSAHDQTPDVEAPQGERASVQALLDEGAVALHDTAYVLDKVRLRLTQLGRGFFRDEAGAGRFADLGKAGEKLDSVLERLKVRFQPQDEIVVTFERADEATLAIYRALELLKLEPEADPGDQYARRQVIDLFDEKRTEIDEERSGFDSQRAAFIAAAQRVAGVRLPSDAQ